MKFEVLGKFTDTASMLEAINSLRVGDVYHITFTRYPDDPEREANAARMFWRICGDRTSGDVMPLEMVYEAQQHNLDFVINAHAVHGQGGLGWAGCFTYKVRVRAASSYLRSCLDGMVREGLVASIDLLAEIAAAA